MVLGGGEGVEAQFLGGETYAFQLIQETLITLVVPSDRGELLAVRDYAGHGRIGEYAEFHEALLTVPFGIACPLEVSIQPWLWCLTRLTSGWPGYGLLPIKECWILTY